MRKFKSIVVRFISKVKHRVLTILCLTTALGIAAYPDQSFAGTVFGQATEKIDTKIASPTGVRRPTSGGTFDLHAVAFVEGAAPTPTQAFHVPSQPDPFFKTFFPMKFGAQAFNPINPADKTKSSKIIGGFAIEKDPGPNHKYQTAAKAEVDPTTGILVLRDPVSTQEAFRQAVSPKNGLKSNADAIAKIRFDELPGGGISVSAAGSFVSTEADNTKFDPVTKTFQRAPENKAASLVHDPLFFTGIEAGDILEGSVHLSASDFKVRAIDDGIFSSVLEVGSDIAGTSPGAIGMSSDGAPLMFRLGMRFTPDSAGFFMDPNAALLSQGGLQFYDPNGNLAFSQAPDATDYFLNRMLSELQFDNTTSTWSLAHDLDLFTYRVIAPQALSLAKVDLLMGQVAAGAVVPEPSTLSLFGLGVLGLLRNRQRRKIV